MPLDASAFIAYRLLYDIYLLDRCLLSHVDAAEGEVL